MNYNNLIGIAAFLIFWFLSRYVSMQGLKYLDENEKINLATILSKYRLLNMTIPLLLLFIAFAVIYFTGQSNKFLVLSAFSLFFLYMLVVNIISFSSLAKADLPKEYLVNFIQSRIISMLSIIALMACIMFIPL